MFVDLILNFWPKKKDQFDDISLNFSKGTETIILVQNILKCNNQLLTGFQKLEFIFLIRQEAQRLGTAWAVAGY